MDVLYILVLLHLLYDFHWQGDYIANEKAIIPLLMVVHVLTWTMLMGAALHYFGMLAAWKLVVLFVSHYCSDNWKCHLPKSKAMWPVYLDQSIHALSLVVVAI